MTPETATETVVEMVADSVRLLRFGAATRNTHRIHYDAEFAKAQRLDGPVVMAQLHGCLLFRAAARWAGDPAWVLSLGWQNRTPAYAGARLRVTVTVRESADGKTMLDLEEHADDVLCVRGSALVHRPPITDGSG